MSFASQKFRWTHDGKYTGGATIPPADYKSFTLFLDGALSLEVFPAWNAGLTWEQLISDLTTALGAHTVKVRMNCNSGKVSAWSPDLAFTLVADDTPSAPTAPTIV